MKIIWDKGTHLMVEETNWQGKLKRRRINRFLCIGGPTTAFIAPGSS
jgi:hypothetical protein